MSRLRVPDLRLSALRRRTLRLVLSGRPELMPDITTLRRLPASSTYPVRRNGINPVPHLGETRDREPVTRLTRLMGVDIWLVTGFDEAREVLADRHRYSNDMRHVVGNRPRSDAEGIGGLGMTDPPDHTRLRGLLTPEFTKHRLGRLQGDIDEIVADALDDVRVPRAGRGSCPALRVRRPVPGDLRPAGPAPSPTVRTSTSIGAARFDLSQGGVGVFDAATVSRTFLIEAVPASAASRATG